MILAILASILIHFAADWKQLVTSYPACLWGLSPIKLQNIIKPFMRNSTLGHLKRQFLRLFWSNFLLEVASDEDKVALDVHVKFGDCSSICS